MIFSREELCTIIQVMPAHQSAAKRIAFSFFVSIFLNAMAGIIVATATADDDDDDDDGDAGCSWYTPPAHVA